MKQRHNLGKYDKPQKVTFELYQTFPYSAELETHISLGLMGEPMPNGECLITDRGFTLLNYDVGNLMLIGQVWVDLSQFGCQRLDLWCKEFPETICTNYHLSTKCNSLTLQCGDLFITIENDWRYAGEIFYIGGNPTKEQTKLLEKLGWLGE